MRDVEVRRHVAAPVERVWAVTTDLGRAPQVVRGIDAVEVLTPGDFGVGTRWRETRTMLGRSATEEMTVTSVEPQRSYTTEAVRPGVRYVSRVAVAPAGDGSELTMTFGARPTSVMTRLLGAVSGPLGRRAVVKAMEKDLADLAAAAERP
jgi:uncharacterized membrane protein